MSVHLLNRIKRVVWLPVVVTLGACATVEGPPNPDDPLESFKIFQGKILHEYDELAEPNEFAVVEATQSILEQQQIVRRIVREALKNFNREPRIA